MKVQVRDSEDLSNTAAKIALAVGQREAAEHRRDRSEAGLKAAQAEVRRLRAANTELLARVRVLEALNELEEA